MKLCNFMLKLPVILIIFRILHYFTHLYVSIFSNALHNFKCYAAYGSIGKTWINYLRELLINYPR